MAPERHWAIISLGGALPRRSMRPTRDWPSHRMGRHIWRRAASRHQQMASSLLGLAPDGGYLAARITARAGGLLHHLFTL